MGYSIIFETKIVLLSDGRLIHFDRSGCNNDDAGRKRSEFTAKIYSREEFESMARRFIDMCAPYKESQCFDLKIGSRPGTFHDYGSHLLRMLQKAVPYHDFIKSRHVSASYCRAIELLEPEQKEISLREFEDVFHKLLYSGETVSYRRIMEYPSIKNESEIVVLIEGGKPVQFFIGRAKKKK